MTSNLIIQSRNFERIFSKKCRPLLFGMIHVPALPGSPKNALPIEKMVEKVQMEAEIYAKCGIDGIILENMHDIPYQIGRNCGPEICASMTRLCVECVKQLGKKRREQMLLGVQILAAANREALAVAQSAGLDFIRAEAFIFAHIADEGWMNGCAGDLLRYRRKIGAEKVAILTDVKKKHCSHSITADLVVEEMANAAEFFLSDGIILTGNATGKEAKIQEFKEVHSSTSLPILIGSGISIENVEKFADADGFIVGSHFKYGGKWFEELEEEKVQKLVEKIKRIREEK